MFSLVHTLHPFSPPLHPHAAYKSNHKPLIHTTHIPNLTHNPNPNKLSLQSILFLRAPTLIPRAVPGQDGSPETAAEASETEQAQKEQDSQSQPDTTITTNDEQKTADDSKPNTSTPPIAPPVPVPVPEPENEESKTPAILELDDNDEDEEEEEEVEPDVNNNPAKDGNSEVKTAGDGGGGGTLRLAVIFGLWYLQNVIFNIYNKKVLNLFPYPWLLASFQLLVGSLWMAAMWASGLQPRPRASRRFLAALAGPALFHAVGHISACVSFSHASVSFTHVIKSAEPAFSVALSALHGSFYPIHVWLAVVPIIAGCSLAAVTEVSFSSAGLWGALISNVGFVLRNIYSKQSLYDFKHIDGLNLYGWISIVALLYLFPVAVVVEGRQWVEGFRRAVAVVPTPTTFYIWVVISGVFYHLYNQSSYQALDKISPLTFSVGNTMKRVVVIVASVLVFRNPITPLNALGSAVAILGTFLYSQATAFGKNKKKNEIAEKES